MPSALPWFPVVGLLMGMFMAGVALFCHSIMGARWPEASAAAVLVVYCLLTRGLHLDGLADWADGFWGSSDRAKTLSIMKDSAIGSFGAIALICVLLAKWTCLTRLIAGGGYLWIASACVVSRAAQVILAALYPYARTEGGTAVGYVTESGPRHAVLATGVTVAIVFLLFPLQMGGLLALVLGGAIARLFGDWCNRRVGGITGDLIGAGSELSETAVLALGAVLAGP